jgi:hypothetical protein
MANRRDLEAEIETDLKDRLTYSGYLGLDRLLSMPSTPCPTRRIMMKCCSSSSIRPRSCGSN